MLPFIGKLLSSTEVLFVFQFYPVLEFGLGNVREEGGWGAASPSLAFKSSETRFPTFLQFFYVSCFNLGGSFELSSSFGCRAGDYKLPPAAMVLGHISQLSLTQHAICVT